MSLPDLLLAFLALAAAVELAAWWRARRSARLALSLGAIAAAAALTLLWRPDGGGEGPLLGAAEDGGTPTLVAVAAMLVAICLGIAARAVFDAEGTRPDWLAFARPLVISPILLLPLIGTLDDGELQPLQLVSLAVLAFQHGFFWQKMLSSAEPARLARPPAGAHAAPIRGDDEFQMRRTHTKTEERVA